MFRPSSEDGHLVEREGIIRNTITAPLNMDGGDGEVTSGFACDRASLETIAANQQYTCTKDAHILVVVDYTYSLCVRTVFEVYS